MEGTMNQGVVCKCVHHKVIPTLVSLFGLVFLLKALGVLGAELVDLAWPTLVLLAGLSKLKERSCKCCAPMTK